MGIRTFFHSLKQGIINLFKNRLMTVVSVGTIAACLLMISIFYIVSVNVENMIDSIQNNVGIEVFFEAGMSEEQILEIKGIVELRTEVYETFYTSADEAWQTFKVDYFEGHENLLGGFEEDNPLADSASLRIYLADITKQGELVDFVNSLQGIRYIQEDRMITDIIESISEMIQYVSIVLIAVLVIISVFLISNTIRIGIEIRKKEINIMKYIGATDGFIRGPYLVEGALIGILGSLPPLVAVYYLYDEMVLRVSGQFSILNDYLQFIPVMDVLKLLVPVSAGAGIAIGIFGSLITITKHLKV